MTGLVVLVAVVLRWVGRVLIRVADWFDPEPGFVLDWPDDDGVDADVIELWGPRRRA